VIDFLAALSKRKTESFNPENPVSGNIRLPGKSGDPESLSEKSERVAVMANVLGPMLLNFFSP
jgi:hypothetical protein